MIPLFKVAMAPNIIDAVGNTLTSGFIGQGECVEEFEQALRDILPAPAVATSSCTAAIEMVLTHLGVGPGDEVITTPLTCVATNAPIVHLGARPVWADVSQLTGNISPHSIAEKITRRTKAIIAVDWTGRRADYTRIRQVTSLPIIQDAAHGPILGRGNFGDYICSSYGPIKHLTCGDGGSVATLDAREREALRLLRWYGLDRTSSKDFRCEQNIERPGMKWHMNDINATIGLANLPRLRKIVERHQQNARWLYDTLAGNGDDFYIHEFDEQSNYWVFPILVTKGLRDRFQAHLTSNGIMSSQVHARTDKHSGYQYPSGTLSGLDSFSEEQLNLPCGWWLTTTDLVKIADACLEWKP